MPKKGSKKKKGPQIDVTPEVVQEHTGFMPNDIVSAPFGQTMEIEGVEMVKTVKEDAPISAEPSEEVDESGIPIPSENPQNVTMGVRVWAKLPNGQKIPLRPTTPQQFEEMGYRRVHEAVHILRDTRHFETRISELLANAMGEPKKKKADGEKKGAKGGKKGGKKKKK